jgi:hypothetical protein
MNNNKKRRLSNEKAIKPPPTSPKRHDLLTPSSLIRSHMSLIPQVDPPIDILADPKVAAKGACATFFFLHLHGFTSSFALLLRIHLNGDPISCQKTKVILPW